MKKLMKKKVSLLGKEFSVFALVAVMMVGLASAALVPYLSLAVSGTANVASPFNAYIADGLVAPGSTTINGDHITLTGAHGGDTVEATVKFEYLGEIAEDFNVIEMFMINSTGITCEDFVSIEFDTCTTGCTVMENDWTLIPLEGPYCNQNGVNSIVLTDGWETGINKYKKDEINVDQLKFNFKLNALGDYILSAQILPAP